MAKAKKTRRVKATTKADIKEKFDSTESSFHTVPCKHCDRAMIVDKKYDTGVCWVCIVRLVPPPPEETVKVKRVRGWQFMEIWVDPDGTVYEKGKENPKLKGKYKPSDPEKIRTERSKKKSKKSDKPKISSDVRQERLAEIKKLKDLLKKETRKTYSTQITRKINSLQKSIK